MRDAKRHTQREWLDALASIGHEMTKEGHDYKGSCPLCGGGRRFVVRRNDHVFCRDCFSHDDRSAKARKNYGAVMAMVFPGDREDSREGGRIRDEDIEWVTYTYPSGATKVVGTHDGFRVKGKMRGSGKIAELYRKVEPGKTVILAEGEKDVHTLEKFGLAATTNPNGSGESVGQYAPEVALASRIIIIPDVDAHGMKLAMAWATALDRLGAKHEMLDLSRIDGVIPESGFDVSDLVLTKGVENLEDLAGFMRQARPPGFVQAQYVRRVDDATHIWNPYIRKGHINLIAGDEGDGKSLLTLTIAAAMSRGEPMWEHDTYGTSTLYISAEDEANDQAGRYFAAGGQEGKLHLVPRPDSFVLDDAGLSWIVEQIRRTPVQLVVVDPLREYLPKGMDLNEQQDVAPYLTRILTQLNGVGATLLGIWHHNKRSDLQKAIHRLDKGQNFTRKARSSVSVFQDRSAPFSEQRFSFVLAHSKANNAEKGQSLAYQIRSWDEDRSIPVATFRDVVEFSSEDLMNMEPVVEARELSYAQKFLREYFVAEGGYQWSMKEISSAGRQLAITVRTIREALMELGADLEREDGHYSVTISDELRCALASQDPRHGLRAVNDDQSTMDYSVAGFDVDDDGMPT